MLRTLMLVALVLVSTAAFDALFSANASDQILRSNGFVCRIRNLGCSELRCCAQARCSKPGVTSGWVPACWDIVPLAVPRCHAWGRARIAGLCVHHEYRVVPSTE
jgi:hypothetical protein